MCINFYHTSTNGTNFSDDDADLYRNIRYIGDFVLWEQECFVTHKLLKTMLSAKTIQGAQDNIARFHTFFIGKKVITVETVEWRVYHR